MVFLIVSMCDTEEGERIFRRELIDSTHRESIFRGLDVDEIEEKYERYWNSDEDSKDTITQLKVIKLPKEKNPRGEENWGIETSRDTREWKKHD